jgi:hypothetical protein
MRDLDFEEKVLDGKYTFRVYKDGHFEILRYDSEWIENAHTITGSRAVFALVSELHELRVKHSDSEVQS